MDIKAELKNIDELKNDIMAVYCVDDIIAIYEDNFKASDLTDAYNKALSDNKIFKDKYYYFYYDENDNIEDADHGALYGFLESLEMELKGALINE